MKPGWAKRGTAFRGGLGAILVAVIAACGGGNGNGSGAADALASQGTNPGVLSMTLTPRLSPTPDTAQALAATYAESEALAREARSHGRQLNLGWGVLEPADSGYDAAHLQQLQGAIDAASAGAASLFVGLQTINTNHVSLPGDLAGLAFDDPALLARFRSLLDRVLADNRGRIRYLSLGNEVDIYLEANPDRVLPYMAFLENAITHARQLDPSLRLGVTVTAEGVLGTRAALIRQLGALDTDALMITYYPVRLDPAGRLRVRDPAVVNEDFERLLAFAGSRPLVFQEAGYPASPAIDSSQALQAEFIRQVFAAWRAAGGRIPYLNILSLHDFTDVMCDQFVAHYGMPADSGFRDYLCTLGMRQSDGQPRAAWSTLVEEAARTLSK